MIRILCFAVLELISPLHVGSGKKDDPLSDNPVLRAMSGLPFIPGGTLSGIFSQTLGQQHRREWLGHPSVQGKDDNKPSRVVFDDAFPIKTQWKSLLHPVDVRTSVTIKRKTLTAKQDHLFQTETLPKGLKFCFCSRFDADNQDELDSFKKHVENFLETGLPFGGKTNSGIGQWKTEKIYYVAFDMTKSGDLKNWMLKGHGFSWNGTVEHLKDFQPIEKKVKQDTGGGKRWRVKMKSKIDGLHLVAAMSGIPVKKMPDIEQATRRIIDGDGDLQKEYVDYGSSVKGQFRSIIEMILRTRLHRRGYDENQIIQAVPVDPAPGRKADKKNWDAVNQLLGSTEQKGNFRANEMVWKDAEVKREDHIKLCEFTQQTISGAKFEFAPLCKGKSELEISLPSDAAGWQKELVSHAARLLSLNILPFGGHASRGYLGVTFENPSYPDGDPPSGYLKEKVDSYNPNKPG